MNLRQWFQSPVSTLDMVYDRTGAGTIDPAIMGFDPVALAVQPQALYDLGSYKTPYGVLYNRPKTTLPAGV